MLYPVLWLHSEDGRLDEGALAPAYLSVITRAPESVCAAGLRSLDEVGLVTTYQGVATIKSCFSSRGHAHEGASRSRVTDAEKAKVSLGAGARAHPPVSAPPREGSLESWLVETWGVLATKGKPLSDWCAAQETAHPHSDLLQEAKKARAWELTKGVSKKSIRRFLSNWFNRADEFKEDREKVIEKKANRGHWSKMSLREVELAIKSGDPVLNLIVDGVSLDRDLRDDLFILSGQDITRSELPYREALAGLIREKLGSGGDPYEQETLTAALKGLSARAENNRALSWAVDQIVTDVRYELGLLPV